MDDELMRIEQLIYEDHDFQRVEELTKQIRYYDVLIKENDEATFSRLLRFFLDPTEWHGLHDVILRRFLFLLVDNGRRDKVPGVNFSKLWIESLNLQNAKVSREVTLGSKGRIDLTVEIPGQLMVLIENKLFSQEGENQTEKYYEYANRTYANDYQHVGYCFINPDGTSPGNEHFILVTFEEIYGILSNLELNESYSYRRFVLDTLKEWIMDKKPPSPEIQELCRSVYAKHRATLDLIMENAPTISAFVKAMAERVNGKVSGYVAHYGSYWLTMSPRRWLDETALKETSKYSSVRIEYEFYPDKLYLALVFPNEERYKEKVDALVPKLFDKVVDDVYSWKNWGKLFYAIEILDDFVPENLGNAWNSRVDKLTQKIVTACDKIFPELERVLLS